ncbi:MAG: hypothetical protein A2Z16_16900 [Chloroflexi bacterium RBG_16_54_18]|nr:MAG: hypothetical protein A2Z16_16900 [Chloroflexi bacterium RBG_16_54_18]
MNWRIGLALYLLGLVVYSIPASFQNSPGYMDAEYYYTVALHLKEGSGFNEMIIWNYLDDPAGLPHPSNAYWMPLPSILAWIGMMMTSSSEFVQSRIIFILLAAFIPPLTAVLAFRITHKRFSALLAGLIAVFPGFYLPYLVTTETFAPSMVLGALFFITIDQLIGENKSISRGWLCILLGVISGFSFLSRADGLIWLIGGLATIIWIAISQGARWSRGGLTVAIGLCLIGYFVVAAPWLARNLTVFGSPFSPGGSRILWLTDYDQLFVYPAGSLNFRSWLSSGFTDILGDRVWSSGQNIQTIFAIQGGIFLLPLMIIGFIRHRTNPLIWIGFSGWLVTVLLMTIVFPYAGARGGFFHSGAAFQPLWWAITPSGLETLVDCGVSKRTWNRIQAQRFYSAGTIILIVLLSSLVSYQRIVGEDTTTNRWDQGYVRYKSVEEKLQQLGAGKNSRILVNNAPGYYAATHRPSISIPNGDIQSTFNAASKYLASYLILEFDQIQGSSDLYSQPGDRQGLRYLGTESDCRIYLLEN